MTSGGDAVPRHLQQESGVSPRPPLIRVVFQMRKERSGRAKTVPSRLSGPGPAPSTGQELQLESGCAAGSGSAAAALLDPGPDTLPPLCSVPASHQAPAHTTTG